MSPADWVPYCVPGTILSTSLVAYKYPQEPRRQGFIINYLQLRPLRPDRLSNPPQATQ